ncbi:MAG: PadR family transcriptional regulator [Chloroflexota bacterium]
MSSVQQQMRKGTTTVMILKLLADAGEPLHGYQIIQDLEQRSDGYFEFKEGLVYPRLHQMEREGLLRSQWEGKPGTRRRKLYSLTETGQRRLKEELAQWRVFSTTMDQMLGTVPRPTS